MAAKKTSTRTAQSGGATKAAARSGGKAPAKSPAKKSAAKRPAPAAPASRATATRSEPSAGSATRGRPRSAPAPVEVEVEEEEDEIEEAAPTPEPDDADEALGGEARSQVAQLAARVIAGEHSIAEIGEDLVSPRTAAAASAARVVDELLALKPEAVVPLIDRLVKVIGAPAKRPAQAAANALPVMARVAPARVARHLPKLKESFDAATPAGKDGLVRTFAGLCTASVAYQKRLEDVLNKGLREADAKTLMAWTEVVLPALKGEPHARARATVEARLERIPRANATRIADFLGIKLRLRYR